MTCKHRVQHLRFENDFLIHRWRSEDVCYVFYAEKELRRLYRVLGHSYVGVLSNLLRKASPEHFNQETRSAIEDITKKCDVCIRYASKPRRLKIYVGREDLLFNHIMEIDIKYLDG